MDVESIAVVGPTASGKTRRAVLLCKHFNGEVISADSRQIYRDMTIGTGKDIEEYGEIPYHLIDICNAGEKYNLHRYLHDFNVAYNNVLNKGKLPVICGGSGMYVENALSGIIMPEVPPNNALRESLEGKTIEELSEILRQYKTLHNITDIDNSKRAVRAIEIAQYYRDHPEEAETSLKEKASPLNTLIIGIDIPREVRRKAITQRLNQRIEQGMLNEVKTLLAKGISPEDLIYYGLEYKFVTSYIIGHISFDEMLRGLEIAIHQFAKRQMTWFRGMERRGFNIHWIPFNVPDEEFIFEIENLLKTD